MKCFTNKKIVIFATVLIAIEICFRLVLSFALYVNFTLDEMLLYGRAISVIFFMKLFTFLVLVIIFPILIKKTLGLRLRVKVVNLLVYLVALWLYAPPYIVNNKGALKVKQAYDNYSPPELVVETESYLKSQLRSYKTKGHFGKGRQNSTKKIVNDIDYFYWSHKSVVYLAFGESLDNIYAYIADKEHDYVVCGHLSEKLSVGHRVLKVDERCDSIEEKVELLIKFSSKSAMEVLSNSSINY